MISEDENNVVENETKEVEINFDSDGGIRDIKKNIKELMKEIAEIEDESNELNEDPSHYKKRIAKNEKKIAELNNTIEEINSIVVPQRKKCIVLEKKVKELVKKWDKENDKPAPDGLFGSFAKKKILKSIDKELAEVRKELKKETSIYNKLESKYHII